MARPPFQILMFHQKILKFDQILISLILQMSHIPLVFHPENSLPAPCRTARRGAGRCAPSRRPSTPSPPWVPDDVEKMWGKTMGKFNHLMTKIYEMVFFIRWFFFSNVHLKKNIKKTIWWQTIISKNTIKISKIGLFGMRILDDHIFYI